MNRVSKVFFGSIFAILLGALPLLAQQRAAQSTSPTDAKILQDVQKSIQDHPSFKNIQASVDDRIVTLNGSVESYYNKLRAARILGHADDNVQGVRNLLSVNTAAVPDQVLAKKIGDRLRYDRVDEGITFNNFNLSVHNGQVVIGGQARTDVDRDSALAIVENTPGVKDVVDNIEVMPVSIVDDQLRVQVARAIYGDPALQRYALDPQAPIRIVVKNGHVTLDGVVDNSGDKTIAGTQAQSVPGVFSVQNNLVTANNPHEASNRH